MNTTIFLNGTHVNFLDYVLCVCVCVCIHRLSPPPFSSLWCSTCFDFGGGNVFKSYFHLVSFSFFCPQIGVYWAMAGATPDPQVNFLCDAGQSKQVNPGH